MDTVLVVVYEDHVDVVIVLGQVIFLGVMIKILEDRADVAEEWETSGDFLLKPLVP